MNRWSDAVLSMLAGIGMGTALLLALRLPEGWRASSDATHPWVFVEPTAGVRVIPIEIEYPIETGRLHPCHRPDGLRLMGSQIVASTGRGSRNSQSVDTEARALRYVP